MTAQERRTAFSLAGIFSLRMMGLFMILPVFSLYAETLGETPPAPVLIGLAIGIYGLTQALLQIPFGMLSDRIGRKPVIIGGLLIFALGSVVAATADTIGGIIFGRALQGAGAIAAAVMALAADLTREEHRTKAMAIIGMSIGLSFALALAVGPILNHWISVPGIFWFTALLALGGIALLHFGVPRVVHSGLHRDAEAVPAFFTSVLRNKDLLRLDGGIFLLHMILTASFVALPFALRDHAGIETALHGYIYLPVLLFSLVLMVPLVIIAEKHRKLKPVFLAAIALIGVAELDLMLFHDSLTAIVLALLVFFIAFNVLEALLPSLIVKYAPPEKKGTAMGVYSTSQFLGAFTGGVVGGSLYGAYGLAGVFGACAVAAVLWVLLARNMSPPPYLASHMVNVGAISPARAALLESELIQMDGVAEVSTMVDEGVAYLKIDSKVIDKAALTARAQAIAGADDGPREGINGGGGSDAGAGGRMERVVDSDLPLDGGSPVSAEVAGESPGK